MLKFISVVCPLQFPGFYFCQITIWSKKAQFKHHCNSRFLACAHCNFTENKLSFDMRNWTRNLFFCQITTFESGHCNFPEFFVIWFRTRVCQSGFFRQITTWNREKEQIKHEVPKDVYRHFIYHEKIDFFFSFFLAPCLPSNILLLLCHQARRNIQGVS